MQWKQSKRYFAAGSLLVRTVGSDLHLRRRIKFLVYASQMALLLCWSAPVTSAVTPESGNFRNYSVNDGLSQNSVAAIIQDSRGFIWIGTQDGLDRFDGYGFKTYRWQPDEPNSLSDNNVWALHEDHDERLWIGTSRGGLNVLSPESDRLERVPLDQMLGPSDRVTAILGNGNDLLWIGTSAGLFALQRDGETISEGDFRRITGLDSQYVTDLLLDWQGHLWIATDGAGLFALSDGDRLQPLPLQLPDGTNVSSVRALTESADGRLWIGLDAPVVARKTPGIDAVEFIDLAQDDNGNGRVRALLADDNGDVWVAGLGLGLQRLAADDRAVSRFTVDPESRTGLDDIDSQSLFVDRTGVLWIGTLSAGIDTLDLYSGGFELYQKSEGVDAGLQHNMVAAFAEGRNGDIWIGTDGGGVDRFDSASNRFENYNVASGRIGDDRIWALHAGDSGRLWAGSWGGGLFVKDAGDESFRRVALSDPGRLPSINDVASLAEDARNQLWIGTIGAGLKRLDIDTGTLSDLSPVLPDGQRVQAGLVGSLFFDPDVQSMWIATEGDGLLEARPDGSYRQWTAGPGKPNGLPSATVRSISPASNNRLLVATSAGLAVLDRESGEVTETYRDSDGLPPGVIYAALEDDDGVIWVSSNRGLARIHPEPLAVRRYDPRDGLQGFEFNRDAVLMDSAGYFYFGGTNGVTRFRPDEIRDNPFSPPLALTGFSVLGEEQVPGADGHVLERAITHASAVTLEHQQNVITLEFAGLHFVSPERNRYAYRLEGFDRDWIATDGGNRLATYTNLDPGSYRFQLRGANSNDVWGAEELGFDIEVLAPWWLTGTAMLTDALLTLLAITAFVRWRTLSLRAQADQLRQTVAERTALVTRQKETIEQQAERTGELLRAKEQLFARVSHEFRTPLTLILGSAGRLKASGQELQATDRVAAIVSSGERLLRLVEQLLFLANNERPKKQQATDQNFSSIVSSTLHSFSGLAESRGIELQGDIETGLGLRAEPEVLETIVLNLLSNAIKFSPSGSVVSVKLSRLDDMALLAVDDEGPGIEPDLVADLFEPFRKGTGKAAGSGLGLALVKETTDGLGGSVTVENKANCGAHFEVRIPGVFVIEADGSEIAHAVIAREVEATRRALAGGAESSDSRTSDSDTRLDARVMIVEDDPELRSFLREVLQSHYEVVEAKDGDAGLRHIQEVMPDVIISDVMMPKMDGFDFCRAIKSDHRTSHIPVVLLTALSDSSHVLQGLEEGADEYLTKPFDEQELRLRLRNLLETRQMLSARVARFYSGRRGDEADGIAGLSRRDATFLERLEQGMAANYSIVDYGVAEMALNVAMSERQLQRKLKALTGRSPSEHLRIYRLHQAAELLERGEAPGDSAFATGFTSAAHFGACFKAYFGHTPGEHQARKRASAASSQ